MYWKNNVEAFGIWTISLPKIIGKWLLRFICYIPTHSWIDYIPA